MIYKYSKIRSYFLIHLYLYNFIFAKRKNKIAFLFLFTEEMQFYFCLEKKGNFIFGYIRNAVFTFG